MATKIRLQRKGRKNNAYYHIVVTDSRISRSGKFISLLGNYNPNFIKDKVKIDADSTIGWLDKGAIPSDTVRSLLSREGILYKRHLQKGIQKNSLTEEKANELFNNWIAEKSKRDKENQIKRKKNKAKRLLAKKESDKSAEPKNEEKTNVAPSDTTNEPTEQKVEAPKSEADVEEKAENSNKEDIVEENAEKKED